MPPRAFLPAIVLLALPLAAVPAAAQVIATVVASDSIAIEPQATSSPIGGIPGMGGITGGSFRVSISKPLGFPVAIQYSISGSATPGNDYTALAGQVTIAPGNTSASLGIVGVDDASAERDETIVITLGAGQGYALGTTGRSATVVLIDADQTIQISSTDNISSEPQGNPASVRFERLGTLRGRLAVPLNPGGSATNGVDYVALPDSVVFPNGQGDVTLTVTPKADNDTEGLENVLVRVAGLPYLPASGVSLELRDATVRVSVAQPTVLEGAGNTASFVLTRSGELGNAVTVPVQLSGTATNGVDVVTIPSSAAFAAGSATVNVPVAIRPDTVTEGPETLVLTVSPSASLGAGVPNAATLVIDESSPVSVASLTFSTNVVTGGSPIQATLLLNGAAPPAGATVTLNVTSSTPGLAQLSVTSLQVPSSQSQATFTINTSPVSTGTGGTVTAGIAGTPVVSRNFNVSPPLVTTYAFSAPNAIAQSAQDSTAVGVTVTLNGPAPAGFTFSLSSNNAALVVPASITIPAGSLTTTIPVKVAPVATSTTVSSTITRNTPLKTATLTLAPPAAISLTLSPTSVRGEEDGRKLSNATLQLSGAAPAGGISAAITAQAPASPNATPLVVAPFATLGTVSVTAVPVSTPTTSTVTVTSGGVTQSASLTVNPPVPIGLNTVVDSLITTSSARLNGTIRLGSPAPQAHTVPLASSLPQKLFPCDANAKPISAIGVTNSTSQLAFQLCSTPVTARTPVTLVAGVAPATVTKTVMLVPEPPRATLVLADADVVGGLINNNPTGTLVRTLTQRTDTVTVSSSDPSIGFLVNNAYVAGPLVVIIPSGQSSVGFQFATKAVPTTRSVTLTVSPNGVGAALMVRSPPVLLGSVGTAPQSLRPGTTPNFRVVHQNVRAPAGGLPIQLSTSNPLVTVPPIVTVPVDSFGVTFAATIGQTSSDVNLTMTAQLASSSSQLQLKVLGPVTVQSMTAAKSTMLSGDSTVVTVTLTQPAPVGGTTVALSAAGQQHLTFPPSILVPEGQSVATFPLKVPLFGVSFQPFTKNENVTGTVGGTGANVTVSVTGHNLNFTPQFTSIIGGDSTQRTIALNLPAPPGGLTITSVDHPLLALPDTIIIPAGQTTANIPVVSQVTVSQVQVPLQLRYLGTAAQANVSVAPVIVQTVSASPLTLTGGQSFTLTATLNAPARPGGQLLTFSAAAGSPVTLPTTATVPQGATSLNVPIQTSAVTASIGVAIGVSANAGSTRTITVVIVP